MSSGQLAQAIAKLTGYNPEDLLVLPQNTLEKWYREIMHSEV